MTLRRRVSRYYVATGSGPVDRIKIDCVFGALKAAYWVAGIRRGGGPADLAVPSVASDNFRILFCGIPKVASRSISTMLFGSPAIAAFPVHRHLAMLAAEGGPYRSHFKFSFVRNPWSRIASCYCDKILILQSTGVGKLSIMAKHPGLFPGMAFDAFVDWLCSAGGDQCADRHWMSQHKFVSDDNGRVVCDFVGKLENMESDFKTVRDATNLPPLTLPHSHRSRCLQLDYRDLYNDRTRTLIGRRYELDVDTFKYVF